MNKMKHLIYKNKEQLMNIGFILLGIAMSIIGWYDVVHKLMFGDYRDLFFGLMSICEGGMFGLGALPYVIPNWIYSNMTKNVNKELKAFLIELPSLGFISICLGTIFVPMIFTDIFQEDWIFAVIPAKIVGLFLVCWFLKIIPGGYPISRHLNYGHYASKYYVPDLEEKHFDQLVKNYKSDIFTYIPIALFILIDFIIGLPLYHTGGINSDILEIFTFTESNRSMV